MSSSYTMQVTPQAGILLVDDYPDGLEVWSLYLRMCGFEVFTAADGVSAIEQAQSRHPSIVILDLELPKMGGIEAARRLRADSATAGIPLIAVTGHSDAARLDEARLAGFDLILIKPCDPDRLVGEIQRLLAMPNTPSPGVPSVTLNRHDHSQPD